MKQFLHTAGRAKLREGVTLIEMVVVMTIVALIAGIAFPAFTAGLDSIRLHSAADSVAAFLDAAANRVERRQEVMEVVISPHGRKLALYSTQPGFERTLDLPANINLAGDDDRRFILMPGSSFPRVVVDLTNAKGAIRRVALDPITGAPQISNIEPGA